MDSCSSSLNQCPEEAERAEIGEGLELPGQGCLRSSWSEAAGVKQLEEAQGTAARAAGGCQKA